MSRASHQECLVGRVVAFGVPEVQGVEGDWYMELAARDGRRVVLRDRGLRVAAERAGFDVGEVVTVTVGADVAPAVKRQVKGYQGGALQ